MLLTALEKKRGLLSENRLAIALRTFRDSGLLIIENAYDADFIKEVRDASDKELERYLESKGGIEALEGKTFGKNHIGFFPPLFPPLAASVIVAHPVAVQIMARLLGDDLTCSFYHTNTAYPGSGIQPIHRDGGQLFETELNCAHPVISMVLNIPLCDFTVENGSTEVWPGTHLIVDQNQKDAKGLEFRAKAFNSTRFNLPLGSLALRDLRVWHRGMPNNADYPRTMLAIVYKRGWLATKTVTIPKSTWESWPEQARSIFRNNTVVEDALHKPTTWDK